MLDSELWEWGNDVTSGNMTLGISRREGLGIRLVRDMVTEIVW